MVLKYNIQLKQQKHFKENEICLQGSERSNSTYYCKEKAKLLARVRSNMVKAKNNYGSKENYRFCEEEEETTEHLVVCRSSHLRYMT